MSRKASTVYSPSSLSDSPPTLEAAQVSTSESTMLRYCRGSLRRNERPSSTTRRTSGRSYSPPE